MWPWLVLAFGMAALDNAPLSGQVSLVLGAAAGLGTLQKPFAGICAEEDTEAPGGATIVYAGAGYSAFSVTAGYLHAGGGENGCKISATPPDGVQQLRRFQAGHAGGTYGWLFHLRYSPHSLPFMIYGGTGIRFGTPALGHNRLMSLGAALRTRGRLSVFLGGEVTQIRTRYIRYERQWQNGDIISSTEIERGHDWRKLEIIRFGLEYRWWFVN